MLFVLTQNYLQDLLRLGAARWTACRCWRRLSRPTAGCCGSASLFVLSVYYFPTGIVGRLRQLAARKAGA